MDQSNTTEVRSSRSIELQCSPRLDKVYKNGHRISPRPEGILNSPVINNSTVTETIRRNKDDILNHFRYLKDNLDIEAELLDYCIQEDVLHENQIDQIKAELTRRQKVDCFLRILLRSKESAYHKFLEILTSTKNEHIRRILETKAGETEIDCSNMTLGKSLKSLKDHKETIIKELQPEMIMDYFVQYRQFSIDEYEEVTSERTRKTQAVRFMKILLNERHMPRGYALLLKALKENNEVFLDKLLQSELDDDAELIASNYEIADAEHESPREDESPTEDDTEILIRIRVKKRKKSTYIKKENTKEKKKKGKKEQEKEIDIIKTLRDANIRQAICDRLILDTDCCLHSITEGSIVLRKKGCRKGAIKRLLEKGTSKILGIIVSHPAVMKYAKRDTIETLSVEIIRTSEKEIEEDITPESLIRNSLAFLTEELDPLRFMDIGIFTEIEIEHITTLRSNSRAQGTKSMLGLVLDKPENYQRTFIEEIHRRKKYVWEYMHKKVNEEDPGDVLIKNYSVLIDNICPSVIAAHCTQNKLINIDVYEQFVSMGKPRSWITRLLLHEVMKKNKAEMNCFLHILHDTSTTLGIETNSEYSNRTEDCKGEIETHIKEPRKVKSKDEDQESGYRSLSIKRRIRKYNKSEGKQSKTDDGEGYHTLSTITLGQSQAIAKQGLPELEN